MSTTDSSKITVDNTIEEFDDVGEVHAVVNNNLSVVFNERKS